MSIPTLESFIWYEPNYIDSELCDEIVNRSENSAEYQSGTIGKDNDIDGTIRDVDLASFAKWPDLDEKLYQVYGKAIREYTDRYPYIGVGKDQGYTLLRYGKGQHYVQHVDCFTASPRQVTAIFGLNDEYVGGEFWFWDGAWRQRIEKGALLMFPSSFQYPHGVRPIESGTRYSVITWFV
jgi:hypothetical protein